QHFYDASEGEILIDGVNIDDISLSDLRSAVSVVLQETVLFKGSIRQNILWGKENASDAEIWEALRIAQAADFVKEKKGMLDYIVEAGGRNLSGGQRQRLCIARAIVGNPKLLIFDDSSSALDFATEAALRKALAENVKDTTTVIISQRTTGISFADKIIVMDDGRISGSGTHEELLQSCELYKEIHMSQISGGGE
ncbi:MAG: ABC transporter ATP-binding protein, partial [Clostridia bacterium]|nr:ABC transporter ATP-binding protein [Clostridia bacterium]